MTDTFDVTTQRIELRPIGLYVVGAKGRIDGYIEALKYRDWLAHGRYWPLKINIQKFDYNTVENICFSLINSLREQTKIKYSMLSMRD